MPCSLHSVPSLPVTHHSQQLRYKDPGQKIYWPSSQEISPRTADMKADMGNAADFWQMQSFDGPGPETINGERTCISYGCSRESYGQLLPGSACRS